MEYAKVDGVEFAYCVRPVEILPQGVVFCRLEYDPDGRVRDQEGEMCLEPSDSVLIAIGQGPKDKIVSTAKGIEIDERGLLKTNDQGATTVPGIFASGDVVRGSENSGGSRARFQDGGRRHACLYAEPAASATNEAENPFASKAEECRF